MPRALTQDPVAAALAVLKGAGFSLVAAEPSKPFRCLSVAETAAQLRVSERWVRDNLEQFRGAFRLGSTIRIPERDLESVARRSRIFADLEG